MDDEADQSIGVVSARTGLSVKAIRFYSDRGIVPPTRRDSAGHRLYDDAAVGRLQLVRTLRDLGLDLSTIKRVLDSDMSLGEVAATQAEAIAVQIHVLRQRQAILTVVARQGSTRQELQMVHKAGNLTQIEQRRLIDDFVRNTFGEFGEDPEFVGISRSLRPELPDEPTGEQLAAWIELTELLQDNDFWSVMRSLVAQHGASRVTAGGVPLRDTAARIRDQVAPAILAGLRPAAADADQTAAAVVADFQALPDGFGDPSEQLLIWLAAVNDPRRERYLQLLSVVNDWPQPDSLTPIFDWTIEAVQARLAG